MYRKRHDCLSIHFILAIFYQHGIPIVKSAVVVNLFLIAYHLVFFYCRYMEWVAPVSESNLLRCTYGH